MMLLQTFTLVLLVSKIAALTNDEDPFMYDYDDGYNEEEELRRNGSRPVVEHVVVSVVACEVEENGDIKIKSDCVLDDIQNNKAELNKLLPSLIRVDLVIKRLGIDHDIHIHLEKHENLVSKEVYAQVYGDEDGSTNSKAGELYVHCFFGTNPGDIITATFKLCGEFSAHIMSTHAEYLLSAALQGPAGHGSPDDLVLATTHRVIDQVSKPVLSSKLDVEKSRRKRDAGGNPYHSAQPLFMEIYMVINNYVRSRLVQDGIFDIIDNPYAIFIGYVNNAASHFLEFNLHIRVKALEVRQDYNTFGHNLRSLNEWRMENERNVSWFEKFYEYQKDEKAMHTISDVRLAWVYESYRLSTPWRDPTNGYLGVRAARLPLCAYDSMAVVERAHNSDRTAYNVVRALGLVIGLNYLTSRECILQCRYRSRESSSEHTDCVMRGSPSRSVIYYSTSKFSSMIYAVHTLHTSGHSRNSMRWSQDHL